MGRHVATRRIHAMNRSPWSPMKVAPPALLSVLLSLVVALPAGAQEEPPDAVAAPPADLAEVEARRSRACVGVLNRLAELDRALAPLAARSNRISALGRAISLEDSTMVSPFDTDDPLEAAVRDWFVADMALGRRYAETRDESIHDERTVGRTAIRARLTAALDTLRARAEEVMEGAGDVRAEALPCEGAILVRSAVAEACETESGVVCDALASPRPGLRFVDEAADLWDVEQIRPWTDPTGLGVGPTGQLQGARTAARSRLGNVVVEVGLSPLLRPREELDSAEAAEFDANLDSLGFTFDHPDFVMAPALDVALSVLEPIAGETHYFLHFGDLSAPQNQVVWTTPASGSGPFATVLPAGPGLLARLQAGEPLSLTAVAVSDDDEVQEGEAVYSIGLTPINQSRAVGGVLAYMAGGELAEHLEALVPPEGSGES